MMTERFEVKRGVKLDPETAAADIAQGKFALLLTRRPEEEVEGQYYYSGWTQCPGCGQIGWSVGLNSERPNTIICGACSCKFTVQ
jgi:hypothetical protein